MKLFKSLALAGLVGLSSLYGANYNVDVSHSNIGFKIKHLMISTVRGNFENFSGTFSIDEKSKDFSALSGTVDVASLTTQLAQRDKDLKDKDFFDVKRYPKMSMQLISQTGNKMLVALTIKDITKNIEMDLKEVNGPINDPWGYIRMAFELHGKINRKEFHLSYNKLLETGGLMVGDEVKIDVLIEGIKVK